MSDKGNPSTKNMVVGGGAKGSVFSVRRWRSLSRKQRLLTVLVVVIVIAVVMFVLWPKSKPAPYPAHPTDAQYLNNQATQAAQELKDAKTVDQKAKAYTDLSNIYINKPDGKAKAVDYAHKLVEVKPTADSYSQLAFVLDAAGQYQASADAYNKAASLVGKSGVVDDGRSGGGTYTQAAKLEEAKL